MTPDQALGAVIVVITAVIAGFIVWHLRDASKIRRADRQLRTQWEKEIVGFSLPPWNGTTWDWPETGLAQYLDAASWHDQVYETPWPPVTPVSGPLCPLSAPVEETPWQPLSMYQPPPVPADDADAFIAAMIAHTDAFLAQLTAPLAVAS